MTPRAIPLLQTPLQQAQQAATAQADTLRHAIVDWGRLFDPQMIALGLIRAAVIVLGAVLVYRVMRVFTGRLSRREAHDEDPVLKRVREQRAQTVAGLLNNVAAVAIALVAFLLVLTNFGIDIGPLLATAGILSLAVSFGAQSLVKDIISGAMIIMEGQYAVGDVVRIGDIAGLVERINLRTTILRDLQGVVHVVPNGQIEILSNMTKGWSRAVLDIGVAYKEDVDRVMDVLREIGAEMRADPEWGPLMMEDVEIAGLDQFADSAVVIRLLSKTLPQKQWSVAREMRRRIKNRFDAEGIEIPFPHTTFYWGEAQMPPAPAAASAARDGEGAAARDRA